MAEGENTVTQEDIAEFKALVEKGVETLNSADQEKLEKIEKAFDKQEEKNQEVTEKFLKSENSKKELDEKYTQLQEELKNSNIPDLKEQIDTLEKQMARHGNGTKEEEKEMQKKTMQKFMVKGEISPDELKYLRTDVMPSGGSLLLPPDVSNEILKNITETSPWRSLVRVKQTTGPVYKQPTRTSNLTMAGVGQGGTVTESQPVYGEITIELKKMMVETIMSREMLEDSAFDMDTEIISDFNEESAYREGEWITNGNGVLVANGIMLNANIGTTISTTSAAFTSDDLIDVTGTLKVGYNPSFVFNRSTLALIRKFKAGGGGYLWPSEMSLEVGTPNLINGFPYTIIQDMPSIGSSTKPVAYGDWRQLYCLIDNPSTSILRDDLTLASTDQVKFVFRRRIGGDVVKAEAAKFLVCGA